MTGIRTLSFANALALVSVGAYFLCLGLAVAAPGLFAAIMDSWVHGALPGLGTGARVTAGGMLLGVFTVGGSAWVFGLALAAVYNRLSGRRTGGEAGG